MADDCQHGAEQREDGSPQLPPAAEGRPEGTAELWAGVGEGLGAIGLAPGAAAFSSSTGAGLSTFSPLLGTSIQRETFPSL